MNLLRCASTCMKRTSVGWLIESIRLWIGPVLNREFVWWAWLTTRLSIGVLDIAGFEIFGELSVALEAMKLTL